MFDKRGKILSRKKNKYILKFLRPAECLEDGLVTGGGGVSAVISGGVKEEIVCVNDCRCQDFKGAEAFSDVASSVEQAKKLMQKQMFEAANELLESKVRTEEKSITNAYLGKLIFNFEVYSNPYNYYRALDMLSNEIEVCFMDKLGALKRDMCVLQDGTIIFKFTCSKNRCANFSLKLENANFTASGRNFVASLGNFGVIVSCNLTRGSVRANAGKLEFYGSTKVELMVRTFVNNLDEALNTLRKKIDYDVNLKTQKEFLSGYMRSQEIDFEGNESECVESMLFSARTDVVPVELVEKLYDYGKYLFLISKNFLELPMGAFVTGGEYKIPLDSGTIFSRIYLFSLSAGVVGEVKDIITKFKENVGVLESNAKNIFGKNGVFLTSPLSPFGQANEGTRVLSGQMTSALCAIIYKTYLHFGDLEFLREVSGELLLGAGNFFEHRFSTNKSINVYENKMGISPFSYPKGETTLLCVNPTSEFEMARFVFSMLKDLSPVLDGVNDDHYAKLLKLLPDTEVENTGFIKEFHSTTFSTDNTSPYIPHVFPYNVGFKPYVCRKDYETIVANTIKVRFVDALGKFSSGELMDMALALFTCSNGREGYEILRTAIINFCSDNLIFNHADKLNMGVGVKDEGFTKTIDKNLCLTSCLQNMFLTANKNNLYLFDNLSKDFTRGSVTNLILDNNIRANLYFNARKGVLRLHLLSKMPTSVNIFLPRGTRRVKMRGEKCEHRDNALFGVKLEQNKKRKIKIVFNNL